jgi:hypothetical protein
LAQRDPLAVPQRLDREFDLGVFAVADQRPGGGGQLEVTAQKVGVDVGFDDPFDAQAMFGRFAQVVIDVATRVDHDRTAGGPIPDQI